MDLWVIFITGLTIGGLTCLAVQGGLLASIIAAREEEEIEKGESRKNTVFPTLAFIATKLIAYTLLGFALGAFGSVVGLNQMTQVVMQFVAGLYMVLIALNLLNVHPVFRYAVIQPPRFLLKHVRNQSKSKDLFAPAILGAMTIFIPCGTTLAMEALAISSANPFMGAAIMATFILGTTPLFFGVGWLTSILGDNFRRKFLVIAGFIVLYLGLTSINGALVVAGSPLSFQSLRDNFPIEVSFNNQNTPPEANFDENTAGITFVDGVQNVDLKVTSSGYNPSIITVKKDIPVKINLKASDAYSCAAAFRIPDLKVVKNLKPNDSDTIEFTPTEIGKIAFTCSMGMYRGVIKVI